MKLLGKFSKIIYKLLAAPHLKAFENKSLEKILSQSIKILDSEASDNIKKYLKSTQTASGGFPDKAGNPDLYYTLFGYFLSEALGMNELFPSIKSYLHNEILKNNPEGVHLYCAAILYSKLGTNRKVLKRLQKKVKQDIRHQEKKQPAYSAFLSLLACYYLSDYKSLFTLKRQLKDFKNQKNLPCPVLAASLVLQKSFKKPVDQLKKSILDFYDQKGGFKATKLTVIPDLLSTSVALYALFFADADLRMIKPECLSYIDSLFFEGGFAGNEIDQDPDAEYTFYGLLALGALVE